MQATGGQLVLHVYPRGAVEVHHLPDVDGEQLRVAGQLRADEVVEGRLLPAVGRQHDVHHAGVVREVLVLAAVKQHVVAEGHAVHRVERERHRHVDVRVARL